MYHDQHWDELYYQHCDSSLGLELYYQHWEYLLVAVQGVHSLRRAQKAFSTLTTVSCIINWWVGLNQMVFPWLTRVSDKVFCRLGCWGFPWAKTLSTLLMSKRIIYYICSIDDTTLVFWTRQNNKYFSIAYFCWLPDTCPSLLRKCRCGAGGLLRGEMKRELRIHQ